MFIIALASILALAVWPMMVLVGVGVPAAALWQRWIESRTRLDDAVVNEDACLERDDRLPHGAAVGVA